MCIFCNTASLLLLFCLQWIHSFFFFFLNCCAWCSIFLDFVLIVSLLNAPKSTIILKIQLFASSIFLFFFYFVPFFSCSMLVFSSIFFLIIFCCPLAMDCIHLGWNYALFFCSWDCPLTWLTKLLVIFFFFFFHFVHFHYFFH